VLTQHLVTLIILLQLVDTHASAVVQCVQIRVLLCTTRVLTRADLHYMFTASSSSRDVVTGVLISVQGTHVPNSIMVVLATMIGTHIAVAE
jgi:hypothetical protein